MIKQEHSLTYLFFRVCWAFLLEVLRHLGFGNGWCNTLCTLLSTSTTNISLNGEPGEEIWYRWGLQQGDPLSPMLFVLVMYVLNVLISKASNDGLLQPLATRHIKHRVSLYADDVLFLRPVSQDMELVKGILDLFGQASGLRTSIHKCSVSPIQ